MKTNRPLLQHIAFASPLIFAPIASADIDTLEAWGNAEGTTPAPGLVAGGGTYALTGGGADFWGAADQAVFAWDSTGAMTTTEDFTATVRHVSTDNPAPVWGRNTLSVRATQSAGAVAANDAHYFSMRRSDGALTTGIRETPGAGTGRPGQQGQSGGANSAAYFSVARNGNTLHSGHARDLANSGVAGRWVQYDSRELAAFNGGNEVVVGLGHQSHPQSGGGAVNGGVNTGTFDSLTFQNSYDASPFGAAASPTTWEPAAAVGRAGSNIVTASAFVREGGVATGERNDWTITLSSTATTFVPQFGPNSLKDATPKNANDLVPAANFRIDSETPGLNADIYVETQNGGSLAGNRSIIDANAPSASTVIPSVDWTNAGAADGYFNGTPASFASAVTAVTPAATNFTGNEENYGVHMTGQIYIPSDADRVAHSSGNEWITFQDGIDDYTYVNIDGVDILDDNNWTSPNGTGNGGSNVAIMDVSDAKFDDGEWVDFEMIMWEGGGGDAGKLYWSALDTDGDMAGVPTPGADVPDFSTSLSGTEQLGDHENQEAVFSGIAEGEYNVTLTNSNTGASITLDETLVVPEPSSSMLLGLAALSLAARRRRS